MTRYRRRKEDTLHLLQLLETYYKSVPYIVSKYWLKK